MTLMDSIVARVADHIMPRVTAMVREQSTIAREGIIVKGTYNPAEGTASILLGDTAAVFTDQGDTPIVIPNIPIATPHVGDQFGPIGDERVKLVATQSGYVALVVPGPDDANNAPVGERWIAHRNPTTRVTDLTTKFTNDGATASDGLAGHSVVGGTLHTATTAGGVSRTLNDATTQAKTIAGTATTTVDATAKTITHDVAGAATSVVNGLAQKITHTVGTAAASVVDGLGQKITHTVGPIYTIVDGAGKAISHVVGTGGAIGLGSLASSLPSSASAITNLHLTAFESNQFTKRLDDLTKFATAMIGAGVPNAGAVLGLLATLIHIPVPSGSSIVKIVDTL